jgi:hypothetical protein
LSENRCEMQGTGTVLLAHDAGLRAADVDPRTGFDAICDYARFPVRIEITDTINTRNSPAAPASLTRDARTAGGTEKTRSVDHGGDHYYRRAQL